MVPAWNLRLAFEFLQGNETLQPVESTFFEETPIDYEVDFADVRGQHASKRAFINLRPFRSPYHTIPDASPLGGGSNPSPGEATFPTTAFSSWTNCRNSSARP